MAIAFINNYFPSLSGTFIYREVIKLRQRGFDIETFSIRKPKIDELSEEAHTLFYSTTYLIDLSFYYSLIQVLRCILWRPFRCIKALILLLTRHYERSVRDRIRTLFHYCEGLCFAQALRYSEKITHIHAHYASHPSTVAMVASIITGIPFSFTAHAYDIWEDKLFLIDKVRAALFVITCTAYGRECLLKTCNNEGEDKVITVYHGVDTTRFKLGPKVETNRKVLLNIGRLHPEKGQINLISACERLKDEGYEFTCYIVGDGELYEFFRQVIKDKGLDSIMTLTGRVFQEKIMDYYRMADIFVLPSLQENLPNVLLESLAVGVPVIASNIAGIPEVVKDGNTGVLVSPDSVEELTRAIKHILDDRDFRSNIALNGMNLVHSSFDIEHCIDKLLHVYSTYGIDSTHTKVY